MSNLPNVSIPELLDAGVHFGHKASRWNPKMAPYLYGTRNDVHIIDLRKTAILLQIAMNAIYNTVKNNGKVLFISTKIQARDIMAECAIKCGQHYVNHRWLGGMLTNWSTISEAIKNLEELEKTLSDEELIATYTKKEVLNITRKKDKLLQFLDGIRSLNGKPELIVIIDTNKERLAIKEAVKLKIPVLAVVDSNSDPDNIDFPVPGNDDAIRSIRMYCNLFAQSALAGIEESLIASGVDVGKIAETGSSDAKSKHGVEKMVASKKMASKVVSAIDNEETDEFESALLKEEEDKKLI